MSISLKCMRKTQNRLEEPESNRLVRAGDISEEAKRNEGLSYIPRHLGEGAAGRRQECAVRGQGQARSPGCRSQKGSDRK